MSEAHVTHDELLALQRNELPRERVPALLDHVAGCAACAGAAARTLSLHDVARAVAEGLDAPQEHPDVETILFAYVDGELPDEERDAVTRHLEICELCRQDVGDLAVVRRSFVKPRPIWRVVAAAATVVCITALAIWRATDASHRTPGHPPASQRAAGHMPPLQQTPDYPSAWKTAVAEAVARRELVAPAAYVALQTATPQLRGPSESAVGHVVAPLAERVETTRPELVWTAPRGATSVASLFDGAQFVASSGEVHVTRWAVDRDLARGRVYTWQVEITRGRSTSIIPPPSEAPARFAVIDATEAAELARARVRASGDHLLLAVLYARAGLKEGAERELAALAAKRPDDALTRALLNSLRSWPAAQRLPPSSGR